MHFSASRLVSTLSCFSIQASLNKLPIFCFEQNAFLRYFSISINSLINQGTCATYESAVNTKNTNYQYCILIIQSEIIYYIIKSVFSHMCRCVLHAVIAPNGCPLSFSLYFIFLFFFYPFTYVPHYEYIKIINKVYIKIINKVCSK